MSIFKKKKRKHLSSRPDGGTMLHKSLSFAATEAYKLLRANLMFTLPNEGNCRVVGVTSSIRGEGKSTTATNLSYALAEAGNRVLLVDADLRLPSVGKKLEIDNAPGLSNVLAGAAEAKSAIRVSKEQEGWHILPSGDIPPNPTEMLGSPQMKTLVKALSEDYDFLIFDLPPVNIVSDALVISPLLGGMLVVVRDNYSEQRELRDCTRQLELSNVKVLGFVMNVSGSEGNGYGRYKKNRYKYSSKYYKRSGYYKKHEPYGEVPENGEEK